MNLIIEDSKELLGKDFADWLIRRLKINFYLKLDTKKLIKWDEYLNNAEEFKTIYSKPISSKEILTNGINNLVCDTPPLKLIIHINRNMFVSGLDRVKLETICKLINYGNTSITGYPILLNLFKEVESNIDNYIDMYVHGGI